jgi:hypothetical protein
VVLWDFMVGLWHLMVVLWDFYGGFMGFYGGFMGFYGGFVGFYGGLIGSNGNVNGIWLVVAPTPLKNMTSSVGMMKFPMYGKIIQMFQNHQPVFFFYNQHNQD